MSEHDSDQMVYIAGPMSGIEDYNAPAFILGEEYMISLGIPRRNIFNPIRSEMSLRVQEGEFMGQEAYRKCMQDDLNWICEKATAMYMLNGWENSKGARAEHATAVCLGLQIFYQS